MNPAVTIAVWLMEVFPGRGVPASVLAQLAGSMAGTGLGRLAWGRAVCLPSVDYAAISSTREFGPAGLSGKTTELWIHLVAPVQGAVVGASVHALRLRPRRAPTPDRLNGTEDQP
jgi:glycerol uptake facilitator-like aquaporin